jgi:hypothetical protein
MVQVLEIYIQCLSELLQSFWLVLVPMNDTDVNHLRDVSPNAVVPRVLPVTPSIEIPIGFYSDVVRFTPVDATVVVVFFSLATPRRSGGTLWIFWRPTLGM